AVHEGRLALKQCRIKTDPAIMMGKPVVKGTTDNGCTALAAPRRWHYRRSIAGGLPATEPRGHLPSLDLCRQLSGPPCGPAGRFPHHGQVLNVRLLADENLDPAIIEALRDAGHEMRAIRETNPSAADETVIEIAQSERRVLLPEDKDFRELVYNRARPSPGVLFLRRFPSLSHAKPHAVVEAVSRLHEEAVGKFI